MGGWMDGWVDEWMCGWMDGWMKEWMNGWMDRKTGRDGERRVEREGETERGRETERHVLRPVKMLQYAVKQPTLFQTLFSVFSGRINLRKDDCREDLHGNVDSTKLEGLQAEEFYQSRSWLNIHFRFNYIAYSNYCSRPITIIKLNMYSLNCKAKCLCVRPSCC